MLTTVGLFDFIMCEDPSEYKFIEIAFSWGPGHTWLHTTLEDPWPRYMILGVSRDGMWTLSFGLLQFHGHGSWLMCEVALMYLESNPRGNTTRKLPQVWDLSGHSNPYKFVIYCYTTIIMPSGHNNKGGSNGHFNHAGPKNHRSSLSVTPPIVLKPWAFWFVAIMLEAMVHTYPL